MKNIFFWIFFVFICATEARAKTAGPSFEFPSLPGVDVNPPPAIARGPFPLNPPNSQRVPAKVYLPIQYHEGARWPVLILLHGFTGTAETEDLYLTLRYRVSTRGFILVAPEGTKTPQGIHSPDGKDISGAQFWNATDVCCDFANTQVDDVGYLSQILDQVEKQYSVDRQRIYLFGHSNGGFMANRLACEIGDRFAAIAVLAGGSYKSTSQCKTPTALPYLQVHAVDDPTVNYSVGEIYAGGLETVDQWIHRNGCDVNPWRDPILKDLFYLIPDNDLERSRWEQCQSGNRVELWTIRPYQSSLHNAHVPLPRPEFTSAVLDFLFKNHRSN